jgi:hypothetical protein
MNNMIKNFKMLMRAYPAIFAFAESNIF